MKKIKIAISLSLIVLSIPVVLVSCKKEQVKTTPEETLDQPNLPAETYNYVQKHGVNSSLATLGRVLFYDKNLSTNSSVSCGSCHKQQYAFADNVQFNKGANGLNLKRNSPSIQGIIGFAAHRTFDTGTGNFTPVASDAIPTKDNQQAVLLFWDGRQNSLADMVLNPVLNHNEMNMPDFATLVSRLTNLPYYPTLFKNAYGDESITKEKIAYALEGFVTCLNTNVQPQQNNNTFEGNFNPNAPMPTFATQEELGKFLFHSKYNCATCHDPSNTGTYGSVTSPSQMFNIGLDEVYADNGLGAITNKAGDKGLFKVPTLNNISLTAPYMHDGRFANLGEVLDHYSHNIQPNVNLSGRFLNTDGTPKKLNILPLEKSALIAFLNTLKDDDFLTSPMYSDPFKK